MIDHDLVRTLRVQVADRLNEQRRRDQMNGVTPMSAEDEREYARSLIVQVLEDHARYEVAEGRRPLSSEDERDVATAIHSALFGVGRLQLVVRRARASVSHRRRLRRRPRRRRRHVARAQLRRNLVAQRRELCLEGAHLGVGLGHCGGFCGAFFRH